VRDALELDAEALDLDFALYLPRVLLVRLLPVWLFAGFFDAGALAPAALFAGGFLECWAGAAIATAPMSANANPARSRQTPPLNLMRRRKPLKSTNLKAPQSTQRMRLDIPFVAYQ
jgi:hypothetical protein